MGVEVSGDPGNDLEVGEEEGEEAGQEEGEEEGKEAGNKQEQDDIFNLAPYNLHPHFKNADIPKSKHQIKPQIPFLPNVFQVPSSLPLFLLNFDIGGCGNIQMDDIPSGFLKKYSLTPKFSVAPLAAMSRCGVDRYEHSCSCSAVLRRCTTFLRVFVTSGT